MSVCAAPQHAYVKKADLHYGPSYREIATEKIFSEYQRTDFQMQQSRDGSEYIRRKMAGFDADRQIEELGMLPANWDSYDSDPPSATSLNLAREFVPNFIHSGLIPDAIVPSAEGGVAICYSRGDRYADVEFLNSGKILAVRFSANQDPYAWTIEPNDPATTAAVEAIEKFLSA